MSALVSVRRLSGLRGSIARDGGRVVRGTRWREAEGWCRSTVVTRELRSFRRPISKGLIDVRAVTTVQRRHLAVGPSTDDAEKAVTIRQAFTSPTNLYRYSKQLAFAVIDGVKHFWNGCKLLAADVRVSWRILRKIVLGKSISRRERNLLVSTGADLARLLPFSFFVIVPFMEFLLPFALRFFPQMLPSQFQNDLKKEEDTKKQLKVRLEVAKYFQSVVAERAKTVRDSNVQEELQKEAADLTVFLDDIRKGGAVEEREIFRFARFFNDEVTIDGLVRPQLVAMCKYLGLATYGSDAILRFRIRSKLSSIKNDDMQIMWEGGVDSLTDEEVTKACLDRGIRTIGVSKKKQRRQLGDWLEMSQDKEVPSTLMILSRAFFFTEVPENALKETLSSLPQDVVTDVKIATDTEMTSAERLAELQRQERLIAAEEAQSQTSAPAPKKEEPAQPAATEETAEATPQAANQVDLNARVDMLKGAVAAGETAIKDHVAPEGLDVYMKARQGGSDEDAEKVALYRIAEVLETLESDDPVEKERLELEGLKAELLDLEARITDDGETSDSQVGRLKSGIGRLEREFERTQQKLGLKMKLLDADKDGVIHIDEVLRAVNNIVGENSEELVKKVLERLDDNHDGVFRRGDIKRLQREIKQELAEVGAEESVSATESN